MGKEYKQHKLGEAVKCEDCDEMIVFLMNPATGKTPPVNANSYHGERHFDSSVHVTHFRTCPRYVRKKEEVRSSNRILELYVWNGFEFPFYHPLKQGELLKVPFVRGDVFRLDAKGEYWVSNQKSVGEPPIVFVPKLPKNRLVDLKGNLLDAPAKYLSDAKPMGTMMMSATDAMVSPVMSEGQKKLLAHPVTQLVIEEFGCEVVN